MNSIYAWYKYLYGLKIFSPNYEIIQTPYEIENIPLNCGKESLKANEILAPKSYLLNSSISSVNTTVVVFYN